MRPNNCFGADRVKIGASHSIATASHDAIPAERHCPTPPPRLSAYVLSGLLLALPGAGFSAELTVDFGEGGDSIRVAEDTGPITARIFLNDYQSPGVESLPCFVEGRVRAVLEGGTAEPGEDFVIAEDAFSISVEAGEGVYARPDSVDIEIVNDELAEGEEGFEIELVDIQDGCNFYGGVISDDTASVTIHDDEGDQTPEENPPLSDMPGLTTQQQSIADSLDQACEAIAAIPAESRTEDQQDLLDTCDAVRGSANPAAALDVLGANNAFTMRDMGIRHAEVHTRRLLAQIAQRRQARRAVDFGGLTLQSGNQSLSGELLNAAGAGDAAESFGRWGLFLGGTLELGHRQDTDDEQGYDMDLHNLTAGLDYRFDGGFVAGTALGYTQADADIDRDQGGVEQTSATISAFGSYYAEDRYHLDLLVSYGSTGYETERRINVGGIQRTASADPDGHEQSAALSTGYYIAQGRTFFRLFGGASYLKAEISSYEEEASGAGSGSLLAVDSQTVKSTTAHVGAELGGTFNTSFAVLLPQLSLDWEHQFQDDTRTVSGRFIADPTSTSFTMEGDSSPDRDYGHAAASLNAVFPHGFSAYLSYRTTFARADYRYQDFGVGARLEF